MVTHDPISITEGLRRRDEALDRMDSYAEYVEWRDTMFNPCADRLLRTRTRITSEDVTLEIGHPPGDHRRAGNAMRRYARANNLRKVGVVISARPTQHGGNVQTWERL